MRADGVVADGWFLLQAPKVLLVLSRQQFVEALKRGKTWRRREALEKRLPRGVTGLKAG